MIGQHHRVMCKPEYSSSNEYKKFWEQLRTGEYHKGTFERRNKHGDVIWLEATYFPVVVDGKVTKIMKIASDITNEKLVASSQEAVSDALNRSQAIIEFTPDGHIIGANDNFTSTVKYSLEEIKSKHHRMFCDDQFYQENPNFWQELANGQFKSGQFLRKDKYGSPLWLEATYNPIFDSTGKVVKVIKLATDITEVFEKEKLVTEASVVAYDTSMETVKITEQASELLNSSIELSNDISNKASETTEKIDQLNAQADSIQAIVSTIKAIADQTNLLALNAAIEDVVSYNQLLTSSVQEGMNSVSNFVERGKVQIHDVADVMGQITSGATNVCDTVSQLSQH